MAVEIPLLTITRPAGGDLSSAQYKFVEIANTGKVTAANSAGEAVIGVLQNDPSADGQAATVQVLGISKVLAGSGGIDEGDLIKTSGSGEAVVASKAVTNTSDAGAASDALIGSYVIGICVKAAASGEIGSVLLTHMGAVPTTAA